MNKLEGLTNLAIIAVCAVIVTNVTYMRVAPARAAVAPTPILPPRPLYKAGEIFLPPPGFQPEAGKASLVLVVRDGCKYCEASVPFYQRLVQTVRDKKAHVALVGLCLNPAEPCSEYFKKTKVAVDLTSGVESQALKISGTPTLVLVDERGAVESVWIGQLKPEKETQVFDAVNRRTKRP